MTLSAGPLGVIFCAWGGSRQRNSIAVDTLTVKNARTFEQGPGSHSCLLDHQDRRNDAGRDRRHRHHDVNWDYRAGTALFLGLPVVLVVAQILAKKFYVFLYSATVVASTTFGATMADFADRPLGIDIPAACRYYSSA